MSVPIGKSFGSYQILGELGRGGMAIVYKAVQPALGRYVALKVLSPQFAFDTMFVQRFQQEAVAAARLKHPNILAIYDIGELGGIYYIAMECVEGEPLSAILRRERILPLARVAYIVHQVASALDYAHTQGFVHCDIKPGNIMIGQYDRITLTDFGLVRAGNGLALAKSSVLMGTPSYMSPEQARGQEVTYKTDIYSLGAVTYEMLAGHPPFIGDIPSILHAHVYESPPTLYALNPQVPVSVSHAISKTLAKNPDQRFASAGELAQILDAAVVPAAAQARPAIATPSPSDLIAVLTRPGPRASWLLVAEAAIMALLVALIVFLIYAGTQGGLFARGVPPSSTPIVILFSSPIPVESPTTMPTAAEVVAPTSTVGPSATPLPTTTPVTPSPTALPTISPTPKVTPTIALYAAPTLSSPPDGDALIAPETQETFEWQWLGELGPNDYFEVRLWPEGQTQHPGVGWTQSAELKNVDFLGWPPGKYYWAVAVVRGRDKQVEKELSKESTPRSLTWSGGAVLIISLSKDYAGTNVTVYVDGASLCTLPRGGSCSLTLLPGRYQVSGLRSESVFLEPGQIKKINWP